MHMSRRQKFSYFTTGALAVLLFALCSTFFYSVCICCAAKKRALEMAVVLLQNAFFFNALRICLLTTQCWINVDVLLCS